MKPPAKRRVSALVALLVGAVLATSGCNADSATSSGSGDPPDGVLTGPGVTDTTITVGALTDLTGVYATLGKSLTQAQQLYFDEVNASGGICGRDVRVLVRDHGYDVAKGVAAYDEISPQIVGIPQLLGSSVVTAVLPSLERDALLAIPAAWPSTMLKERYVQIVGATYDIEMINGVGYLLRERRVAAGDKIGHVYFEGEYGENALAGAKFAAREAGLTLMEHRIKPTDSNMAAQVAALKSQGVKAVLMSAGPQQSASLAGTAAAAGLNVPIVSSNPGFAPQLLTTPAKAALERNFYLMNSVQTPSSQVAGIQSLVQAYEGKFPGSAVDNGVAFGYVTARVFGEAMRKACEAKDLTRQGIVAALHGINAFDSDGVMAPLDFSRIGDANTRESYVQVPNAQAKGGLASVDGPAPAEAALRYQIAP
ncbi:ABC transporter substrate-binding protein [Yinghuangia sp. YIM S09857]|uniref:ABC transporter substrate-binding protein n=1 Tax=Yinghuangia sp. YIM S09857 TaxID=3436929 RepID=UPI003F53C18D